MPRPKKAASPAASKPAARPVRPRAARPKTPIASVKHRDSRVNIPTEELRDFVADDEKRPKTVLYPRDPSLDPQLVWKDKDEQDREPLAVPAVPVYIQEKIHPQAIVENVRAQARKDKAVKTATSRDLWVPAINNHGGFGRWAFVEISDPWEERKTIRAQLGTIPTVV